LPEMEVTEGGLLPFFTVTVIHHGSIGSLVPFWVICLSNIDR
jgi:hypothetical protein